MHRQVHSSRVRVHPVPGGRPSSTRPAEVHVGPGTESDLSVLDPETGAGVGVREDDTGVVKSEEMFWQVSDEHFRFCVTVSVGVSASGAARCQGPRLVLTHL